MLRVTYLSRESHPFTSKGLIDLLQHCKLNNPSLGVTGMLIYANGIFLQTLEGTTSAVDTLLEKIERDGRHREFQILKRETINTRLYEDWSMGFEQLTEGSLKDLPPPNAFKLEDFNSEYLSSHPTVVENLLERHRSLHWDPLVREIDARDKFIHELRRLLVKANQRNEQALLVIESLVEASAEGKPNDDHLQLCRQMVQILRQR